jgi:ArsR family transcriptional regulator
VKRAAAEDLADRLKTLSDASRLQLLDMICTFPGTTAAVLRRKLAEGGTELGQPTIAHHLRVLLEAGLVERERVGRFVRYRSDHKVARAVSTDLGRFT